MADSTGNRAGNYVILLPVIMWRADTVCRFNLEKRLESAKRLVTNGSSLLHLARHHKKVLRNKLVGLQAEIKGRN